MFEIDPTLNADTVLLGSLPLCQVRLSRDSQYPWLLLVPSRNGITEIHQLQPDEQQSLWQESSQLAQLMEQSLHPDKLNIAAIGNVVSQLHIHHVARYRNDPCWPKPIWGQLAPIPYPNEDLTEIVAIWQQRLEQLRGFTKP